MNARYPHAHSLTRIMRLGLIIASAYFPMTEAWKTVSVEDFGAKGDNQTDNTAGK